MMKIGRCLLMRKDSGFTMIELLAAIVVLSVLMMVAVPTVMNVLTSSRNRTYVDDSIRLVSTFEAEIKKDNKMPIPAVGNCIVVNLAYLDNNTYNDAPYDGEYDRISSFVVARRDNRSSYSYYPRLVEKLPGGDEGYRGIDLTEVNRLYETDAKDLYVKNIGKSKLFDISHESEMGLIAQFNEYSIACESVIVYAAEDLPDTVLDDETGT